MAMTPVHLVAYKLGKESIKSFLHGECQNNLSFSPCQNYRIAKDTDSLQTTENWSKPKKQKDLAC